MTDVTNDWANGDSSDAGSKPATGGKRPEVRTFDDVAAQAGVATPAELAQDAELLLRKSLETVKVQAEELKRQSGRWALLRSDQAREIVDERPLTVVAAAFALGLIAGAIMAR